MSTILLVDSEPFKASHYKMLLGERLGEVCRVADAAEALCLVEQSKFAANLGLVVSDMNMVGLSGPEFIAEFHERLPRVPILVLGGGRSAGTQADRAVRYLPRPFTGEQLLSAASRLLAESALRQTA